MRVPVALAVAILFSTQAWARLPTADLRAAQATPQPGAAIPLSLSFTDDTGRPTTLGDAIGDAPALLLFSDYTCRTLCGPLVEFAAAGLERSGLRPGRDFRLLVIGINPKDTRDDARLFKSRHIDARSPLFAATRVLIGDEATMRAATTAAGYRYVYDADDDQYAHPTAAFAIGPRGRIVRALSPLGIDAADLRLALVDAGEGRVGSLADHVRLLCYGFDPAKGIYTQSITDWLMVAACLTLAALAAGICTLSYRTPRAAP